MIHLKKREIDKLGSGEGYSPLNKVVPLDKGMIQSNKNKNRSEPSDEHIIRS